jgi:hypothetical protein
MRGGPILAVIVGAMVLIGGLVAARLYSDHRAAQSSDLERSILDLRRDAEARLAASERLLEALRLQAAELSRKVDSLAEHATRFDEGLRGLEESSRGPRKETSVPGTNARAAATLQSVVTAWTTEAVDLSALPDDVRERFHRFDANRFSQQDWPDFLHSLVRETLVPFPSVEQVPEDVQESLLQLRLLHQSIMSTLSVRQDHEVDRILSVLDAEGDYVDEPIDGQGTISQNFDSMETAEDTPEPGISQKTYLRDRGIQRVYKLPYSRFPQLAKIREQEQRSLDHLLLEVFLVAAPRGGSEAHARDSGK